MVQKEIIEKNFGGLIMDAPTHKYYLKDKPLEGSVSSQIKDFYTPFDSKTKSKEMEIPGFKSQQDFLDEWAAINKEAIDRGHRVHNFGERYAFDKTLVPSCPQEKALVKFWDELPAFIQPVFVEAMMYHHEFLFPGTADLLLLDLRDGSIIIADYKTNKDIFKNFQGQTLLAPFEQYLDSPFNHYQIQLSFYQLLLEQTGLKVKERKIIYLKLDGEYEIWNTEDLTNTLKQHLKLKYNAN